MADLSSISAALGGIKHATDVARALRDTDRAIETSELRLQVADLMNSLADARLAVAEVQEGIEERDAEIARLQQALQRKAEVTRHEYAYYEMNADGHPVGAPYCSYCWERHFLLIHMHTHAMDRRQSECPNCGTRVPLQRRIEPE